MTILLLLELSTADRVAVDYAEFLTYKILATDATACTPLLLPILSPSPTALVSFLQSSNSGLHCLKAYLNKILCRTFSKSVCKEKSIKPKSVCLKHKDAGVKEISFFSDLHLQSFLKFHAKLIKFYRPWGSMNYASNSAFHKEFASWVVEMEWETGILSSALPGGWGTEVKALCPGLLCLDPPSPAVMPLPMRHSLLLLQGCVCMGACPARWWGLPESRNSFLPGHCWRSHPGSEHTIPRAASVVHCRNEIPSCSLISALHTCLLNSIFQRLLHTACLLPTHPCQLLHCVASSVFQHMRLSQYGLNTSICGGGGEQEGSLHHQCVCVCVCVCGGGGPLCHTKAQVVLFKLAEAGCVEAPFHQWVLGPNRCLFEYVHSAFHLLSLGWQICQAPPGPGTWGVQQSRLFS